MAKKPAMALVAHYDPRMVRKWSVFVEQFKRKEASERGERG